MKAIEKALWGVVGMYNAGAYVNDIKRDSKEQIENLEKMNLSDKRMEDYAYGIFTECLEKYMNI